VTLIRFKGNTVCEMIEVSENKKSYNLIKFHNEKLESVRLRRDVFNFEIEKFYIIKRYFNYIDGKKIKMLIEEY